MIYVTIKWCLETCWWLCFISVKKRVYKEKSIGYFMSEEMLVLRTVWCTSNQFKSVKMHLHMPTQNRFPHWKKHQNTAITAFEWFVWTLWNFRFSAKLLRHTRTCKMQHYSRLKDNFWSSCKVFHKQTSWEKCCVCGMSQDFLSESITPQTWWQNLKNSTPQGLTLHFSIQVALLII